MIKLFIAAILAITPISNPEVRRQVDCPHYSSIVAYVGFPLAERATAHKIMYRESRCLPRVFNSLDPNGGSIGLFQVNMFWCKPSRYFKEGWLQNQGVISSCSDLYNPLVNVAAAKEIYDYSLDHNGNGWNPWLP